jgi:hypothetical protein
MKRTGAFVLALVVLGLIVGIEFGYRSALVERTMGMVGQWQEHYTAAQIKKWK